MIALRVRVLYSRGMTDRWTVRRMMTWMSDDFRERGIDTARLDAELLVAHALGISRVGLYMDLDRPLDEAELGRARELVMRRRKREPVAYLLGKREFWGLELEVTKDTLVPRPDTETLVERALAILPKDSNARVLDLGTGTGAIAVAIAKERPGVTVVAVDISREALDVAERNARKHGVFDRMTFCLGDLFDALDPDDRRSFDLVVSNPPYIPEGERPTLQPDVLHEPSLALFSGDDGLDCVRRILEEASDFLVEDRGTLLVEVGAGQAPGVIALLEVHPRLALAGFHRDLGRIERVFEASSR